MLYLKLDSITSSVSNFNNKILVIVDRENCIEGRFNVEIKFNTNFSDLIDILIKANKDVIYKSTIDEYLILCEFDPCKVTKVWYKTCSVDEEFVKKILIAADNTSRILLQCDRNNEEQYGSVTLTTTMIEPDKYRCSLKGLRNWYELPEKYLKEEPYIVKLDDRAVSSDDSTGYNIFRCLKEYPKYDEFYLNAKDLGIMKSILKYQETALSKYNFEPIGEEKFKNSYTFGVITLETERLYVDKYVCSITNIPNLTDYTDEMYDNLTYTISRFQDNNILVKSYKVEPSHLLFELNHFTNYNSNSRYKKRYINADKFILSKSELKNFINVLKRFCNEYMDMTVDLKHVFGDVTVIEKSVAPGFCSLQIEGMENANAKGPEYMESDIWCSYNAPNKLFIVDCPYEVFRSEKRTCKIYDGSVQRHRSKAIDLNYPMTVSAARQIIKDIDKCVLAAKKISFTKHKEKYEKYLDERKKVW